MMLSPISKSKLIRKNGPISELKDGSELVLNNGLFILNLMNSNPEKGEIFKFFPSLDLKENELRAKIDLLIKTNALDELTKEQEQKKEKFVQKKKVEETTTIVINKKVSQAEKKKLMKQQKKNEEVEDF